MTVAVGIWLYCIGWAFSAYFLSRHENFVVCKAAGFATWSKTRVFWMNTFWPLLVFFYAGFWVIDRIPKKDEK